jgi:hypothetical protein
MVWAVFSVGQKLKPFLFDHIWIQLCLHPPSLLLLLLSGGAIPVPLKTLFFSPSGKAFIFVFSASHLLHVPLFWA